MRARNLVVLLRARCDVCRFAGMFASGFATGQNSLVVLRGRASLLPKPTLSCVGKTIADTIATF